MTNGPITTPLTTAADARASSNGDRAAGGRKWGMVRGESMIAGVALSALVILIASLAVAGWWSARIARESLTNSRFEQARAVCELLGRNAEAQLGAGALTAVRRSLVDAKSQNGLYRCQIILPDGRILADSDVGKITAVAMPSDWPPGPLDAAL